MLGECNLPFRRSFKNENLSNEKYFGFMVVP